jgi:NurA-like 5'-3' nuclease
MFTIRDKDVVLKEYAKRYEELDKFVMDELSKEYDRYIDLLKNLETREEAIKVFDDEIAQNEVKYTDNAQMRALEGSTHAQFMEILAAYGLIVFFRDNMIE